MKGILHIHEALQQERSQGYEEATIENALASLDIIGVPICATSRLGEQLEYRISPSPLSDTPYRAIVTPVPFEGLVSVKYRISRPLAERVRPPSDIPIIEASTTHFVTKQSGWLITFEYYPV